MISAKSVTRRSALKKLAAGAAGLSGWWGNAVRRAQAGGAVLVERQDNGAEIWQVTSERLDQSNIYCEVPYCSRDSRYFVYGRRAPKETVNRMEFVVVELGTWKQERLDTTISISGCAVTPDGTFYYLKKVGGGEVAIMRADLGLGQPREVYRLPPGFPVRSLGTVTSSHRWYAAGTKTQPGWKRFDILLVDLKAGRHAIADSDPYILNPHPQFDPADEGTLMVQHNRGGRYTTDGKLERLVGPEGATLYLLSIPDGKRTELPVGKPHTTPCTGHEAWIGRTGEILLTVSASGDYRPEKGNLLGVRAGGQVRVVARGHRFNHVGVSRCGRLFSADDWQPPFRIVIGSTRTGRTAVACESKTKPSRSQSTHPHPYLTPNLKWVIFNSNRSGWPHIHAARLPDGMVESLLS
ncbi:MAG: hypothetical protein GXP27_01695 [Planctomycetes bacterium]|nr:hypothetical protein [Planctomycetota bacterium]